MKARKPKWTIFTGDDGALWWRFRASNGDKLAGSLQGFSRRIDVKTSIATIIREGFAAAPDDIQRMVQNGK